MEIHNPDAAQGADLTPGAVVAELDRHIVGQPAAKRAVAVALRNRWRRKQVPVELRDEIAPKNIILIGPTGVGKTEIARRLAKLARAPFVKVEATKFTEVGYVGKDVETMVRDLVEAAVHMVRSEMEAAVAEQAAERGDARVLDALLPASEHEGDPERAARTREKLLRMLKSGHLDERTVEIEVRRSADSPGIQFLGAVGFDQLGPGIQDALSGLMPKRSQKKRIPVEEAREILKAEEAGALVDGDRLAGEAVRRAQEDGIIFIDEIDKIASSAARGQGPDVSREGVQRDILPIVEGTTVNTRHGPVRTDHVLFIAAGAFHVSKPSDLIPELQGRFPIRVELQALLREDLERILVEPQGALLRQYTALLATEGVGLRFTDAAVTRIAAMAAEANSRAENIGARRLHTVLEALLEELSFDAPSRMGQDVLIDVPEVERRLLPILGDQDLARYIL
jgi:ATP-dependent HslUV protease ATP-binding subunit HslU